MKHYVMSGYIDPRVLALGSGQLHDPVTLLPGKGLPVLKG
jgi:hypothetical protein